jgi:hypothetical protein
MAGFNIPANIDLDIVQSSDDIFPAFEILTFALSVICRIYISDPLLKFYSV